MVCNKTEAHLTRKICTYSGLQDNTFSLSGKFKKHRIYKKVFQQMAGKVHAMHCTAITTVLPNIISRVNIP